MQSLVFKICHKLLHVDHFSFRYSDVKIVIGILRRPINVNKLLLVNWNTT